MHTNLISNPAILSNNYILLLSDLCACMHTSKENGIQMKPYSSLVTNLKCLVRLQSCEKAMGMCTAQCKMLLCCVKNHCERVTQI